MPLMIDPPHHPDFKLLPQRIDWIAKHDPLRIYAKYPLCSDNIPAGFKTITFLELANAIDRASWWLSTHLDATDESFAYWGPSDLRWSILLVAAIKNGKLMIHASPWARLDGLLDMFYEVQCSVIVCDSSTSSDALSESPFTKINIVQPEHRSIDAPSLIDWLEKENESRGPFEYHQTWEDAADLPVACFHTSGITDRPKPLLWTNRRIASWHSMLEMAGKDSSVRIPDVMGKTVFSAFMPAHMEGHNFQCFLPIYLNSIVVLRHPSQNLGADTIRQIMVHSSCDGIIAPPGVLAQLSECPRALGLLRASKSVIIGGQGLSEECHGLLQHPGVDVHTLYFHDYGFPYLQKRDSTPDSRYVTFHESSGATFQPHLSGHMELVVQCNQTWTDYNCGFQVWSDLKRHQTGDLFSRHQSFLDRWKFRGRTDRTILLRNGERFNASEMEKAIEHHPLVKTAVVYGELQPRPLLVIEPWSDVMDSLKSGHHREEFLNEIWSYIEDANEMCSSVGRLDRQLTWIMKMPLVRTIRHEIDRKCSLQMLEDEIKEIYAAYGKDAEEPKVNRITYKPAKSRGDELRENLRRVQAFREMNPLQW